MHLLVNSVLVMVFDSWFCKSVLNSSFVLKSFFYWSFPSKKIVGRGSPYIVRDVTRATSFLVKDRGEYF